MGLRLISVSRYIEKTMASLGRLPKGACVVHNGCDTNAIAMRAVQTRENYSSDDIMILMVARLDPIKDHSTLIRALALMPETVAGRRVVLNFVGDGALRAELERLAIAEGVSDRVHFLGSRDDIPELLGRAAVFCLSTTRDEGFGVVLIEALAAGVPIVASDVPACSEVLENGKLGMLVPPRDVGKLAEALLTRLQVDKAAPELWAVNEKYGEQEMAKKYMHVLGLEEAH